MWFDNRYPDSVGRGTAETKHSMTKYVPLSFEEHPNIRVRTDCARSVGDNVMYAPVFPHEFTRVQANYPIIMLKEPESSRYRPIALFGFEKDQNLFLNEDKWRSSYIPLSIRMKPFIIGRRASELSVHIDIEHSSVSYTDGEVLFTQLGQETTFLKEAIQRLSEIHESEQSLPKFCAVIDELNLIEPFTLEIMLNSGATTRLVGYYTISQKKIEKLAESELIRLHETNYLLPIFMMIASIEQVSKMVDWRLGIDMQG